MPATLIRQDDGEPVKISAMLYAIIASAVFLLLSAILIFNSLVRRKNDVQNAFADEGLTYTPDGYIPMDQFVRSQIFTLSCDRYSGFV
jgi:hypothetical protein